MVSREFRNLRTVRPLSTFRGHLSGKPPPRRIWPTGCAALSQSKKSPSNVNRFSKIPRLSFSSACCHADCSLGGQGLGEIARVLSTSAFVTELDLSVNEIDANGLRLFVESLQAARSPLRTLSLAGNDLGDSGSAPCAVLLERNSLTSLDLACCGIGRAGAARIATALWRNTRLASLDLEENNCGPIGAARIAAALSVNTGLRSLNLCSNTIGDEGAAAIGSVLGCNSTLEKLFLARNGLTRDGAVAFAGAVETNFSLKQVTLVEPDRTDILGFEKVRSAGQMEGTAGRCSQGILPRSCRHFFTRHRRKRQRSRKHGLSVGPHISSAVDRWNTARA